MAKGTPLTLRAYRLLTAALTPLSSLLLWFRGKRGKEHPERMGERRGEPSPREALRPLERRLDERRSPAEETLRVYRDGGVAALVRHARLCPDESLCQKS